MQIDTSHIIETRPRPKVDMRKHGEIAVITISNPPVNALSPGVPEGIIACLQKAQEDPSVGAVVMMGQGTGFIGGGDIRNLGQNKRPQKTRCQNFIEASSKPVIAAMHGFALGGGLEVAMACHYRIAQAGCKMGMPEVHIGIIPGAGGTQRLPRLIGIDRAANMIALGQTITAQTAYEWGLVHKLIPDEQDLLQAALALASQIVGQSYIRTCDIPLRIESGSETLFAAIKAKAHKKLRGHKAPHVALDVLQASVGQDFTTGIALEDEAFDHLKQSPEAKALRHIFFAEKKAQKGPPLQADSLARHIQSPAVVGGGTMGRGIVLAFAFAGFEVKLLESSAEALQNAWTAIEATVQSRVKRGRITQAEAGACLGRVHPTLELADLATTDLVIEAIFEDISLKQDLLLRLDKIVSSRTIIASNTSALDIDALAQVTKHPENVLGTHFFSPAHVMKLVEIVQGAKTSDTAIKTCLKLAKRLGKVAVVCGNSYGFVANRSRIPFYDAMHQLVENGLSPDEIDAALEAFGFPMGPFAVLDLAGGDVSYAVRKKRYDQDPEARRLPCADALYQQGHYGQKTGTGWYSYHGAKRSKHISPEAQAILDAFWQDRGIRKTTMPQADIVRHILLASVREIDRILEEGIAYRPEDVDVMWIHGFGFPRTKGGILYWAQTLGAASYYPA